MAARHSIESLPREVSTPSSGSWAGLRRPSLAYDLVRAALETGAGGAGRAIIKDRARAYALCPRELDAIAPGLARLSPCRLVRGLELLEIPPQRHFGFGGEIQAINLRGAILYARYSRAKARQVAGGGGRHEP